MNTLHLGDCLYVLRENIPDESVEPAKKFASVQTELFIVRLDPADG